MRLNCFHQLVTNGKHWCQGGQGILEDHRHLFAADLRHFPIGLADELLAQKLYGTCNLCVFRQ